MDWHAVVVVSVGWLGLVAAAVLNDAEHRGHLQVGAGGQVSETNPSVMRKMRSGLEMGETKLSFMQSEDLEQDLVIAQQEAAKAGSGVGLSDQRLQEFLTVTSSPSPDLVRNPSFMEASRMTSRRGIPILLSPGHAAGTSAAAAAREQGLSVDFQAKAAASAAAAVGREMSMTADEIGNQASEVAADVIEESAHADTSSPNAVGVAVSANTESPGRRAIPILLSPAHAAADSAAAVAHEQGLSIDLQAKTAAAAAVAVGREMSMTADELRNQASEVATDVINEASVSAPDKASILRAAVKLAQNEAAAPATEVTQGTQTMGVSASADTDSQGGILGIARDVTASATAAAVHAARAAKAAAAARAAAAPTAAEAHGHSDWAKALESLQLEKEILKLERERVEYMTRENEKASQMNQAANVSDSLNRILQAVQDSAKAVQRNSEAVKDGSEAVKHSSNAVQEHAGALRASSDVLASSSQAIHANSKAVNYNAQAVRASSQVVSEHSEEMRRNSAALKASSKAAEEISKSVEKSARSARTSDEVAKPTWPLTQTSKNMSGAETTSVSPSSEQVNADADAVSDDLASGSKKIKPNPESVKTPTKKSDRISVTTTMPELDEEQLMSKPVAAWQLKALGPNKSAVLVNRLRAELSEEKERLVRDEKVLATAVGKLSSGKPLADFVAGMDTGEIPRDGLSQEQLQNMTQDAGHAQFALKATVKILGQILTALSSGKSMADAIFGSDTSDLVKPQSSLPATSHTPRDAFEAMDTNKDGSIQRKEWDKAPRALQTQQRRPWCSSDDLRQIFTAMDSSCQASVGRALITDLPNSLSKFRELCPCIIDAVPRLGQAFLGNDCMPAGMMPLSKLCPRVESPSQSITTLEAAQQRAMASSSATVDASPFTRPALTTQESLPSAMRPEIVQQGGISPVPQCNVGELQQMFGAMDDKCKASVSSNFVTNPLNPSLELDSLCMCITAATRKLALRDCAPQGQGRPSFQMICSRPVEDDDQDQTNEEDTSVMSSGLSSQATLASWGIARYTELADEIRRLGKQFMATLPK